jgi:hypothetical protein
MHTCTQTHTHIHTQTYTHAHTHTHTYTHTNLHSCTHTHTTCFLQANELLNWCHHLNFSNYASEWTSMACTLASEADVPGPEPGALLTRALPAPHQDVQVGDTECDATARQLRLPNRIDTCCCEVPCQNPALIQKRE